MAKRRTASTPGRKPSPLSYNDQVNVKINPSIRRAIKGMCPKGVKVPAMIRTIVIKHLMDSGKITAADLPE